jgi:hypothetical protein
MIVNPRVVAMAFAVACATGSGVAGASPQAPPPPPCTFTLSAPLAGSGPVTATVRSTECAPLAVPYLTVACLQPVGGAQFCSQAHGADPAQVTVPYQPGVTYIATGRGCARWMSLDPAANCQLLGPDTVAP